MSLHHAKENLHRLAEALGTPHPKLDEDHACALFTQEGLSIHFQYNPESDQLIMLIPLLEGLPRDDKIRAQLYATILEAGVIYARARCGHIGLNQTNNLLFFHELLPMGDNDDAKLLTLLPPFLQMAQIWKEVISFAQKNEAEQPKRKAS